MFAAARCVQRVHVFRSLSSSTVLPKVPPRKIFCAASPLCNLPTSMQPSRTRLNWRARSGFFQSAANEFKLDENLPRELADDLARLGHDADTVESEGLRVASDIEVLRAALKSNRILMTLDKGVTSLLENETHQRRGIVLFRPVQSGRGAVIGFVRSSLQSLLEIDLVGRVVVVTTSRIRVR